jgi:molybdate transport system regulatory protein
MSKARRKSRGKAPADASSRAVLIRGQLGLDVGGKAALTEAGADLLEQISISGSLSEAARQLHYSYRWAWLTVNAMNRAWGEPLVTTATGGKKGGGARLTELGTKVLAAYRHLQIELEHFLDQQHEGFLRAVKAS